MVTETNGDMSETTLEDVNITNSTMASSMEFENSEKNEQCSMLPRSNSSRTSLYFVKSILSEAKNRIANASEATGDSINSTSESNAAIHPRMVRTI
jgi:hypothetical protein